MVDEMNVNTGYNKSSNYNPLTNSGVDRQKASFKKLLFGDNDFVPPAHITIGDALLKTWHTAAGKAE